MAKRLPFGQCVAWVRIEWQQYPRSAKDDVFELVRTAKPDLETARRWNRRIDNLLKLLDRDKIPYESEFRWDDSYSEDALPGSEQSQLKAFVVVITYRAQQAMRVTNPSFIRKASRPAPLTHEQCAAHRKEAEQCVTSNRQCFRARMKRNLEPPPIGDRYRWKPRTPAERARQQRIGHALARILKRHKCQPGWRYLKPTMLDYIELDAVCNHRVCRLSKLPSNFDSWLAYIIGLEASGRLLNPGPREYPQPTTEHESVSAAIEAAKADLEFWAELERLTETRQRYAPGADCADDTEELRVA